MKVRRQDRRRSSTRSIDERRADPAGRSSATTSLSLLLRAEHEDGSPLDDQRDPRRAADHDHGRLRDDHQRPRLGFERLLRSPDKLERLRRRARGRPRTTPTWTRSSRRPCGRRPVVPVVARRLRSAIELGGYMLPGRDRSLMVSIYLVHNDPETYPGAGGFRPERFLDGTARRRGVDPLRRRRPPLPRRQLRPARDEGRAAPGADHGAASAPRRPLEPRVSSASASPSRRSAGAAAVVEELVQPRSSLGRQALSRRGPRVASPQALAPRVRLAPGEARLQPGR